MSSERSFFIMSKALSGEPFFPGFPVVPGFPLSPFTRGIFATCLSIYSFTCFGLGTSSPTTGILSKINASMLSKSSSVK